jgi:hypothetical protein
VPKCRYPPAEPGDICTTGAVAGGPAAFSLDRFYRGERITVFLANAPQNLNRELKLLPDTNGPATLLRTFGTIFPWRIKNGLAISVGNFDCR